MTWNPDTAVTVKTEKPKSMKATSAYYIAVAALLVGCLGGYTAGYFNVQPKLTSALEENSNLEDQIDQAEQDAIDADAEAILAITDAQAVAEEKGAELDDREAKLEAREATVAKNEVAKAAREMTSGFHTVGKTVEAGVYDTTVTGDMCYYAWKTGTGADADIIDNNIVESGPATVTLVDGQFFEVKGCGTWVKQ